MFVEERLLECVTFGTTGGPTWLTRKIGLKSGIIRRNAMRSRPLHRYTFVYRNLTPDIHKQVIDAFNACMGGAYSFRVKDWSDFEAIDEELPVLGTGASQNVQLVRTYSFGNRTVSRPIRKPVDGTVVIKANGVPIASVVDPTTGIATFTAANGAVLTWEGEFDVPVMFDDDELQFSEDEKGAEGLFLTSDVSLSEDLSV